MSTHRPGSCLLLFLFAAMAFHEASAQVAVTLTIRNPMPSQLTTWENDPTLVQLIVVNTGQVAYPSVRASFVVKDMNNNATVLQSKDNDPSMPQFPVPPFGTVTRFGPDLVNANAVSVNSSYQTTATNTNSLPEGQYEFCVTLLDQNNAILGSTGQVCQPFSVVIPDPPSLLLPTDQAVLSANTPTNFTWTPVMGGPPMVSYQLTIVPIFQTQSPHDALQSNTALFQKTLNITSYLYTQADPPFSFYPDAIGYAWQVQALDQQNLPAAKNQGQSQIFSFTLQGAGSSTGTTTLDNFYPFDNDTIPWIPPHIIAVFNPYSDSIKSMDFTTTVNGSDASSYSSHRTLLWPNGPLLGQGFTDRKDTVRARYIIVDQEGQQTASVSSWAPNLKRGVKYTWSVSATFTKKDNSTVQASTGTRSFYLGATPPHLVSPQDQSTIDTSGQPVTLTWMNLRPDSLNPPFLYGMGSTQQKSTFKGVGQEKYRLEMSHDSLFATVDTVDTAWVPIPPDSTGGDAGALYGSRSFTLAQLPPGKYFWRVSWLDNGSPYVTSPVWSFMIGTGGGGGQTQQKGGCNDPCTASAPSDQTPSSGTFNVGDILTVGKFSLSLTKVTSGSGSNLTGEGTVAVPVFHAPIKVTFTGLKVNAEKQVFSGNAEAVQDNGSPLPQSLANQGGSVLGLDTSQIRQVYNFATQAQRLVSALVGNTPVALPIGFDDVVEGSRMTIALIGMTFTPTLGKLNAVMLFPIPDLGPGVGLGLGARDICFSPTGIGGSQGTLYLAGDLGYNDPGSWSFLFKAPAQSDSGTFVSWDCNGFQQLRLEAQVHFPREWLVPSPDNGSDSVKGTFVANIRTNGNWMASVNLDKCTIAGTDGFGLEVQDMYYDHSDLSNPPGMTFPKAYGGNKGNDWHGFYIKQATVTLPKGLQTFKGSPPTISAGGIIIDRTGFTGSIAAANIIQYPQGDFGSWGASLDSVGVDFVSSSLQDGKLNGRIQIPISDGPIRYSALISLANSKTRFLFTIKPDSEITASLWAAKLSLDPTSHIDLVDTTGKFIASATLDGSLSINGNVGSLPKIDLQLLKFQGLSISTNSPYLSAGTWKFGSPDHGIGGFPISISDIGFATGSRTNGFGVGLKVTAALNLSDVLSGSTSLTVWAVINPQPDAPQAFAFDGVDLDSIYLHTDLGVVQITGSIVFYHDDPTYGNGFLGQLQAVFLDAVQVNATALFGSVSGYRYWYVDASTLFPNPGVVIFPGVGFYGFGGGAWYHMNVGPDPGTINGNASASKTPGMTLSGYKFTPDPTIDFGFKAMITMATSPGAEVFSADVILTMQFTNGGVGAMSLAGKGYMLCSSLANRTNDYTVFASVSITYDFANKVFDGNFNFNTNPSFASVFSMTGWMNLHFDQNNWHILIGTPSNREKLTLVSLASVDAYLMAGTDIPAPDFNNFEHKAEIEQAIGSPLPNVHMPISGGATEGFALGASQSIDTGELRYLIFFGRFTLGYGFDVAVTHDATRICDNLGTAPGIDGWYAMGQLYAYVEFKIGLHVDVWFTSGDFTILDCGAGARCVVMAPNPVWVEGTVGGHYNILNGLVQGDCSFTFDIGTKCQISSESPLAVDMITDMKPADGSTNVDVFAIPQAAFTFPIDQNLEFNYVNEDGNPTTRTFRVEIQDFSITRADNGQRLDSRSELSSDGTTDGAIAKDIFPQYTQLVATITVYGQEFVDGGWVQAKKRDGTPIVQTKSVKFTTGKRPDDIPPQCVAYAYPLDRQQYFLQGEIRTGKVVTIQSFGYLFQEPGTYVARFIPLNGGDTLETSASCPMGSPSVTFQIPTLANGAVYALQIVRKPAPVRLATTALQYNSLGQAQSSPQYTSSLSQRSLFQQTSVRTMLSNKGPILQGVNLASLVQIGKRVLPGTAVRPNEKLLYSYYFQTSKYNTLADKIKQLTFSKTDYSKYWGTHELLSPSFTTSEFFDGYDVNGYDYSDGVQTRHANGLVHVDAHLVPQSWYTSYVWPHIYSHIQELQLHRLWNPNVSLSDQFFLLLGMVNFNQTVQWASGPSGKLYIPSVDNPVSGGHRLGGLSGLGTIGSLSRGGTFGMTSLASSVKFNYLHPSQIPDDYFSLWFRCFIIMLDYNNGAYSDPDSYMYGQDGWIQSNLGWIQGFSAMDLQTATNAYQPISQDYYRLYFIYGPHFTWDQSGPWITLDFPYGTPQNRLLNRSSGLKRF
jgi:hypothetical protein